MVGLHRCLKDSRTVRSWLLQLLKVQAYTAVQHQQLMQLGIRAL
jgi:hypothetical protein